MRIEKDEYFLRMAWLCAQRSTCMRRSVGCVLVNARGHVIGTGYNGVAAGEPHCNHHDQYDPVGFVNACSGAFAKSGEQLDACGALHAEWNALLQCNDVYQIETAYCTTAPCVTCTKLFKNTSCDRIVFLQDYPHSIVTREQWISRPNAFTGKTRTWVQADDNLVKRILGEKHEPEREDVSR